jgi:hypothetical protein
MQFWVKGLPGKIPAANLISLKFYAEPNYRIAVGFF